MAESPPVTSVTIENTKSVGVVSMKDKLCRPIYESNLCRVLFDNLIKVIDKSCMLYL